jgi:hypothetical protein
MAPIIYMVQTMLWIAHNDRKRAEQISKQVTRTGEANGIRYIVIDNKED